MEPRMNHPAMVVPNAMEGLQAVGDAVGKTHLPEQTFHLVHLRVSQINGCGVCMLGELGRLKEHETDERMILVAGWREAPHFTDAERAALALAEAVTRLSDRPDPVSDDVWAEAARHYDEETLGALVLAIANINLWNRLNVATKQVAGAYEW
jgi:alkylhydroperoxidase family enzyme